MAIWGMGSHFGGSENQIDSFLNENFVCLGYTKKTAPDLIDMMKEIKIGDIIFIKSFKIGSNLMHINAIGIVTEEFKCSNSHKGYENCDNEIGVKWFVKEKLETVLVDDKYKQRKTSLFLEYNKDVQKIIVNAITNNWEE